MGSNPYRKIKLLAIAHPIMGITIQVLKVHLGMGCIRGLRGEEMDRFGLIFVFCKNMG